MKTIQEKLTAINELFTAHSIEHLAPREYDSKKTGEKTVVFWKRKQDEETGEWRDIHIYSWAKIVEMLDTPETADVFAELKNILEINDVIAA